MSTGRMQAKDIDDEQFLTVIDTINAEPNPLWRRQWACWWDILPKYPDVPWKVLLAKASTLMRQGKLEGCDCGCRGDFYVLNEANCAIWGGTPYGSASEAV